jgi:hypothetical protein
MYMLACVALPQAWAILVARAYAHRDKRRRAWADVKRAPDYTI